MSGEHRQAREVLNAILNWVSLAYGLYATAIEPVWEQDDVQIAVGGEVVLLALIGFLWAGQRRSLGWALITTGVAAPIAMYSTASLYWDEVDLFTGEAFWTALAIGTAIGLPLVLLGVHVLRRTEEVTDRADPWWLLVVLAFRSGDWYQGVTLVYAGGGLALLGLLVALPRRLSVTVRGSGLFLLFLGAAGLVLILVSSVAVGSHMSADEAMLGVVPAAVVAALGGILMMVKPGAPRAGGVAYDGRPATSAEPAQDIAIDVLHEPTAPN